VLAGATPSYTDTVNFIARTQNSAGLSFGYDANGNLTSWSDPTLARSLTYDSLNRLVEIDYSGGRSSDLFSYDGANRRAAMSSIFIEQRLLCRQPLCALRTRD
jgi:YD repeat-containing protein